MLSQESEPTFPLGPVLRALPNKSYTGAGGGKVSMALNATEGYPSRIITVHTSFPRSLCTVPPSQADLHHTARRPPSPPSHACLP